MNWYISVLKNYAVFKGRARRKEYWMFTLFHIIFIILAVILDGMLGTSFGMASYGFVFLIYLIGTIIPNLAVTVRRLHDTGRSGWWYFISLVPFVGGIILLVFMCLDSVPGSNKWGPNPKEQAGSFGNEALDSHVAG